MGREAGRRAQKRERGFCTIFPHCAPAQLSNRYASHIRRSIDLAPSRNGICGGGSWGLRGVGCPRLPPKNGCPRLPRARPCFGIRWGTRSLHDETILQSAINMDLLHRTGCTVL